MIKVLLVDDHDLIRAAIKKLLQEAPGIKVVGEACSGEDAIKLCKELVPAVVLMDLNMPGIGGLEATRKILRHNPIIRILILTVYVEEPYPSRLLHMGVAGYITKYCSPDEMLRAIKSVYAGEHYISQDIAQKVALSKYSYQGHKKVLDVLSKREIQIMLMIIQGKQATTIASELFLSSKTINTYRYRIFKKLDIQTDVELTLLGMRLGLLASPPNQ